MPWKQNYTTSNEQTLPDSDLRWPDGNRCCFSITVDLSVARSPDGIRVADIQRPDAFFALNDGLDSAIDEAAAQARFPNNPSRSLRSWQRSTQRFCASSPSRATKSPPTASGMKTSPTWTARTRRPASPQQPEILTEAIGRRPDGWFSMPRRGAIRIAAKRHDPARNTLDLLIEAGYTWFGNGLADDIPHYWVTDFATNRAILTLPYYYHFDDQFFLMFPAKGTGLEHADSLARNWARGIRRAMLQAGPPFLLHDVASARQWLEPPGPSCWTAS